MNMIAETSPKTKARLTGAVYLLTIAVGIIAQVVISARIISSGNAATTASNILANRSLYGLGFTIYMIEMAAQITMTALFYDLLKPVSKSLALLSAVFGYVGGGIKIFARLFYLAPLLVLGGSSWFGGFTESQVQSISLFLLQLNDQGAGIALAFFGFSTVLHGWLIIKSTFLPKWIGVLSLVGGIGWLSFIAPPLGLKLFPAIALVGILSAVATIVWLLVVGVNEQSWLAQAAAAKTSIWA